MDTIPGLIVCRGAVPADQQAFCVRQIDAAQWRGDLHRRTQHYGYVYDYRERSVSPSSFIGPLPDWLTWFGDLVSFDADVDTRWDQAIVNEYRPGVGIGEHSDSRAFGAMVASISLLSSTTILFRPSYGSSRISPVTIDPGDILVMSGPARSSWTHEIRGTDVTARRLSITYRTVPREKSDTHG